MKKETVIDGLVIPNRRKGESEEAYYERAFARNSSIITERSGVMNPRKMAIDHFKGYAEEHGLSPKQAVSKVFHTRGYSSERAVAQENLINGIKSRSDSAWKEFQRFNRDERGRFKSVDPSKVFYHSKDVLIYDGRIRIDLSNSPETISISLIEV